MIAILIPTDPVIFFNLRLSSRTANHLPSSDINKINSDLTRHIQYSINDACQCTLPSYTLRGSIDSCGHSQSNCAIYTGRLLGSDTASATEVFEMIEEWLATQNGSLLSGTLRVDPDCPLRLLSPSDTACSSVMSNSANESSDNDDTQVEEIIQMLAIGIGSGLAIIICAVISCVCVYAMRKKIRKNKPSSSNTEDNEQRHYSVIVERNPSYNRHRGKMIGPIQRTVFNSGHLDAAALPSTDTLNSENPYSYTSLKPPSRRADVKTTANESQGMTHLTVEQPPMISARHSQTSNNEYVINGLLSPVDNYNSDNDNSTFHPTPVSPLNTRGVYLSVS